MAGGGGADSVVVQTPAPVIFGNDRSPDSGLSPAWVKADTGTE